MIVDTHVLSARKEQDAHALDRVADRTDGRRERIALLRKRGGIALADDPERIASRIDRLSRSHPDVRPISPAAVAAGDPSAMRAAGAVLERIINGEDFLRVRFLEGGAIAARAVGRVNIVDDRGRLQGYGTGSMVSPDLLLTNHHVLGSADSARTSTIEFDYEDGLDGRPLQPKVFALDPDRFFLADGQLDFALVAVRARASELAGYGFVPMIGAIGKAVVGDSVTIIQHPQGEKKQVALRENRIVDVLDSFLHYETDTEPGSSGSPVFNDDWELVALHHASVPAPDRKELGGIVNEGIRVSALVEFIRTRRFRGDEQAIVDRLFVEHTTPREALAAAPPTASNPVASVGQQTLHLTVPLEISLGQNGRATERPERDAEAIKIDPDYAGRKGYDTAFLGTRRHRVPLPRLSEGLLPLAAVGDQVEEPGYVLPYHHFSIVLNKERGLAFFTAVNIDGNSSYQIKRESDRWVYDPRLPEEVQTGEDVYADNPLDRGHLVRRLDPAWGRSRAVAKVSNDDTFHFTNCTPQHKDFNQNRTTWAGLEDYILENADNRDLKVSVFTGPVLADDDDEYEGVKLPRQYWKVVAMVKKDESLSVTAYLLSQAALIQGLEAVALEDFSYGAYRTYQVPVRRIEALTGLSFGSLADADPRSHFEAVKAPRPIDHLEEIEL